MRENPVSEVADEGLTPIFPARADIMELVNGTLVRYAHGLTNDGRWCSGYTGFREDDEIPAVRKLIGREGKRGGRIGGRIGERIGERVGERIGERIDERIGGRRSLGVVAETTNGI